MPGYAGHCAAGVAVGLAAAIIATQVLGWVEPSSVWPILVAIFAVLGALLPDLDVRSSRVSGCSGALMVAFAICALALRGAYSVFAAWWVPIIVLGVVFGTLHRHRMPFHWIMPLLVLLPLLFAHWRLEGVIASPLDVSGFYRLLSSPLEDLSSLWLGIRAGGELAHLASLTLGAEAGVLSHLALDLYF